MKLGEICPCAAPCFRNAAAFDIPRPGCSRDDLEFAHEDGRRFYAVLVENHLANATANPRIAIVGLSPAKTQINDFLGAYRSSGSYPVASAKAAFAGLAGDIIGMFDGLGLTERLGLHYQRRDTFAGNSDILATSLLACASLDSDFGSTDFDLAANRAASVCAGQRFVARVLDPKFDRLTHIVLFGKRGREAVDSLTTASGRTVSEALRVAGKIVLNLPHPSGENGAYTKLAKLNANEFPQRDDYLERGWAAYVKKPPKKGGKKQSERTYKARQGAAWEAVASLRREISSLGGKP